RPTSITYTFPRLSPLLFYNCVGDDRDIHSFPTRRSSDLRQKSISVTREPELEKKTLFLQRIVDSDNALYRYTVGDMNYFFYKKKDRKSTRLNSSHVKISYAVFCLKKKKTEHRHRVHKYQS